MEKELLTLEILTKAIKDYQLGKPRGYIVRTGVGGYDLMSIAFEEKIGLKRVFSSKQLPRFFKIKLKKNHRGRYYRLVKM